MTSVTPPTPTTLGGLRASGHTLQGGQARAPRQPPAPAGGRGAALPRHRRLRRHRAARAGAGPARRARHRAAGRARPGQDPADPVRSTTCSTSGRRWWPAARSTTTRTCRPASACRRRLDELGDELPVAWRHRSERYGEKLATPDTSVGDLIGDIDPIKVAEGRTLGDPETVHYGLVPRTNRGIFSVNELPDLAERIQVALLNVLEERDIQVRGYQLRLPLDLLLIASANPEDYTNRGRIITPLKDRFGAEVRTHYPLRLDDELTLIRQEAVLAWDEQPLGRPIVPGHLLEVIARFTRAVRESPAGRRPLRRLGPLRHRRRRDRRRPRPCGGPPSPARRRRWPGWPTCRPWSHVSLGKVEFEPAGGGPGAGAARATCCAGRWPRPGGPGSAGSDLSGLLHRFDEGGTVESGDLVPAGELLARVGPVPGLAQLLRRLGDDRGAETPGLAAAALEFAMEGLHLAKRLAKEELPRPHRSTADELPLRRLAGRARPAGAAVRRGQGARPAGGAGPVRGPGRRRPAQPARARACPGPGACATCSARPATGAGSCASGAGSTAPWSGSGSCSTRRSTGAPGAVPRPLGRGPPGRGRAGPAARRTRPGPSASCADYQWRSPEAAATYEQIRDLLRREVLDSQFRGMRDALAGASPEELQRIRDMVADLNAMLEADARGEDTQRAVRGVHGALWRHVPREPAQPRGAGRRPGPPGRGGQPPGRLPQPRAAGRAGRPLPVGPRRPRAPVRAGPAGPGAALAPARPALGPGRGHGRRAAARPGRRDHGPGGAGRPRVAGGVAWPALPGRLAGRHRPGGGRSGPWAGRPSTTSRPCAGWSGS